MTDIYENKHDMNDILDLEHDTEDEISISKSDNENADDMNVSDDDNSDLEDDYEDLGNYKMLIEDLNKGFSWFTNKTENIINSLENCIFEHPRQNNQGYFRHLGDSFSFAMKAYKAGTFFIIHGCCPCTFQTQGGDTIRELNDTILSKRNVISMEEDTQSRTPVQSVQSSENDGHSLDGDIVLVPDEKDGLIPQTKKTWFGIF